MWEEWETNQEYWLEGFRPLAGIWLSKTRPRHTRKRPKRIQGWSFRPLAGIWLSKTLKETYSNLREYVVSVPLRGFGYLKHLLYCYVVMRYQKVSFRPLAGIWLSKTKTGGGAHAVLLTFPSPCGDLVI